MTERIEFFGFRRNTEFHDKDFSVFLDYWFARAGVTLLCF